MTKSKTKESFLKPADAADLSSIVPGLASVASDTTVAVAVRCEAFGALRVAAATHAAAVASHWRDERVQAALPGLMFATRQNPVAGNSDRDDLQDRAAHASARFLAEFLIAAGGGKAAAALSAAVENDESAGSAADELGGSRKGSRKALMFALQPEASVALWTSVAAEHFPAMAAHASPLVRASGLSALTGLTLEALRGVSKAHRATLTETPRVLTRSDDSANVRAAACRAVGALASFEVADATETETETDADSETVVGVVGLGRGVARGGDARRVQVRAFTGVVGGGERVRRAFFFGSRHLYIVRGRDVVSFGGGLRRGGDGGGRQGSRQRRARARARPRRRRPG
jgi:hypothetical protein